MRQPVPPPAASAGSTSSERYASRINRARAANRAGHVEVERPWAEPSRADERAQEIYGAAAPSPAEPVRSYAQLSPMPARAPAPAAAPVEREAHAQAQEHNDAAIAAFGEGDLEGAVGELTAAIELDWSNAPFYGNRSLALQRLGLFDASLDDAESGLAGTFL
jgi:Flp pilus assembly protein TadD